MQNPFTNPAFSMAALTAAINILPNRYGRIEDLGLMPAKPVRQRQVIVEEMNGVLSLLPTLPPGAPGTVGVRGKRTLRSFVIPHIPHDDVVLPEEVQGIRAFGSETETEAVAGVIARHLETMRNKHAITLEHLRMGALKGVILDADGSVLYDLFDEFDITPQTIAFDLGNAGTNVKAKCLATLAAIEDNLKGEFMSGVHCLCSPEFFSALTGHAKVEKAFENWQQGAI
ncbi:MAG: major capsid protein, partial [Solimonas sp.]